MRHGLVRRLGALIAIDGLGVDAGRFEQFVEQDARAGAQRAVHVTQARLQQVRNPAQASRVSPRHDQPLVALREPDDLVQPRLQQGLVGPFAARARHRRLAGMESGHHAAPLVKGADGVQAARVAHIQVQLGRRDGMFLQCSKRVVVAGV
ncbi:hypothetical protein D9M69_573460 [compost metagenome]